MYFGMVAGVIRVSRCLRASMHSYLNTVIAEDSKKSKPGRLRSCGNYLLQSYSSDPPPICAGNVFYYLEYEFTVKKTDPRSLKGLNMISPVRKLGVVGQREFQTGRAYVS